MKFNAGILIDSVLDCCDYEEHDIKFIEHSDWAQDGKYLAAPNINYYYNFSLCACIILIIPPILYRHCH
jgi:hypothetical protein